MAKLPDDDGGGILMPILVSLLVVIGIGTAGLFGYIGFRATTTQSAEAPGASTSQEQRQTPSKPQTAISNHDVLENDSSNKKVEDSSTESDFIDMDAIEQSIISKTSKEYQSSKWFIVNCDSVAEGSAFVDMQIDQGNDDSDNAILLAAEHFKIAKEEVENAGLEFENFALTVVNKGATVGIFSTTDGEKFTFISKGKRSEISLEDQKEPITISEQPNDGTEVSAEMKKPSSSQVPPQSEDKNGTSGRGNADNFNTYDNAEQQKTADKWVLNTSTKKIHYPSCAEVKKIAPQNYSTSNISENELLNQGYTTCGRCH